MNTSSLVIKSKANEEDVCIVDCATTHTILKREKYFCLLKRNEAYVTTICGSAKMIEGSGKANILLPGGTKLMIDNALFSPKSHRNLLSFKDIRKNGYHAETIKEGNQEFLQITKAISGKKNAMEKFHALPSGLYSTKISAIEANLIVNERFTDLNDFKIWHDRLGHPGYVMMRKIIESTNGHTLKEHKIFRGDEFFCSACSQGKLIIRPSPTKVGIESPAFLERIQGDICGPIHPHSGPFKYFMVLIDASTRWSHVCLLSSRNMAFARLLAQIIRLQAHFPDHPIKSIRMDNAGEFTSQAFDNYCVSLGIDVEHPVAHVHTQNGLAESLIKRLQLIARPLLMKSKLPSNAWGHAILHAAALIRIRPTSYHKYSPLQLAFGQEPNVSHLRTFGCAVYVPIAPPQRTKMGPQRRLGIYVGYESPSIIKYLEPLTGDMFTARFADCHFDEASFPTLKGENKIVEMKLTWNTPSLLHLDPRTQLCEQEVLRIIHLRELANKLPDAFADPKRVTKSYIPAANVPASIDIPKDQTGNESQVRLKRGRPIGSKDKNPRKRKVNTKNDLCEINEKTHKNEYERNEIPKEIHSPEIEKNEKLEKISIIST